MFRVSRVPAPVVAVNVVMPVPSFDVGVTVAVALQVNKPAATTAVLDS